MIAPNKFTQYVHDLEDRYATDQSNSITNVPKAEMDKFFSFSRKYYNNRAKQKMCDDERLMHTKEHQQLVNEFLERTQTNELTTLEIANLMNQSKELTNNGQHLYSRRSVYGLLHNRGLKWKKSKADSKLEQEAVK